MAKLECPSVGGKNRKLRDGQVKACSRCKWRLALKTHAVSWTSFWDYDGTKYLVCSFGKFKQKGW